MTPQKLWVLKAHTKSDKIDDFCQNIRQDFDIYLNIDHQKAKKLKKEQRRRTRHTNKQAIKQINKRTNKGTTNEQFIPKHCTPPVLNAISKNAIAPSYVLKKRDAKSLHAIYIYRILSEPR